VGDKAMHFVLLGRGGHGLSGRTALILHEGGLC
jgi:hypothetical protein